VADRGYEAVVNILLANGADADSKDNDCGTPPSRAARNGHEAVVKLLLERKRRRWNINLTMVGRRSGGLQRTDVRRL
jgi:ankyrin repeat protein